MRNWAADELKHINLGDRRLNVRLKTILEDISKSPNSSIPEACGSHAATKAVYRFFDSERVYVEDIQEGFFAATAKRVSEYDMVVVAQDTTDLDFSTHKKKKGIGYLDNDLTFGIKMHSALAISPGGLPLGLLHQQFWVRGEEEYGKKATRKNKAIEEKESYRWLEAAAAAEERIDTKTGVVMVSDRESDIFDLLAKKRRSGFDVIVRAAQNRAIANDSKLLFEHIKDARPAGSFDITVPRERNRKERMATINVSFERVSIKAPRYREKEGLKDAQLYAILAEEAAVPEDAPPIRWLLLTTRAVETLEDATRCIRWYSFRWLIERYHYVLKSGCQVEELQLEDAERIKRAVAVYSIAAWRLLFLTYLARTEPDGSCEEALEKHEWQALYCFVNKSKSPPNVAPTLAEAVLLIAKLGGFLARKSDGQPGVKVLWRGLKRLNDISQTYLIFHKDVGNE